MTQQKNKATMCQILHNKLAVCFAPALHVQLPVNKVCAVYPTLSRLKLAQQASPAKTIGASANNLKEAIIYSVFLDCNYLYHHV